MVLDTSETPAAEAAIASRLNLSVRRRKPGTPGGFPDTLQTDFLPTNSPYPELEDYPEAKLFLFHGGKRREYINNIQLIPLEEALPWIEEMNKVERNDGALGAPGREKDNKRTRNAGDE